MRFVGLLLVATLCAPLAWTHHYIAPLLLFPAIFALYRPQVAVGVYMAGLLLTNMGVYSYLLGASVNVHIQVLVGVATFVGMLFVFVMSPLANTRRLAAETQTV